MAITVSSCNNWPAALRRASLFLGRFGRCQRAATAIEYGLICALIILTLIGGLSLLGNSSTGLFGTVESKVSKAMH